MTNPAGHRPSLWILEDDPELRTVMVYFAQCEGFVVTEVMTIREAEIIFEVWSRLDRKPHSILSDYNLLDGNAEKFLIQCRGRFPEIPIYCITGSLDSSLASRLKKFQITVLQKPASLKEIFDVILKSIS